MRISPVRWPLASAFLVAALAGCGVGEQGAPRPGPKPAIVSVATVTERETQNEEEFKGRTKAVESVEVKARATGYLKKVYFDDDKEKANQTVKAGQLLYEIDDRTYAADFKKAEADVLRAQALHARLTADLGRARRLVAGKSISREEFDKISANKQEAAADVESVKAVAVRKKLDLDFCKVYAPISGRVSQNLVTVGNLVTADTTMLTSIVSISPIYATFDVDERTVLRIQQMIREGKGTSAQKARVPVFLGTQLDKGFPHEGFIDFIDNRIDPGTGTLRVRGNFPNKDETLSPGLFVRIRVPVGEKAKRVTVPDSILGSDQGQRYVYIVNSEDEVERRDVTVGALRDGQRAIESGLKPGERVIVNGMQRVRPGVKVAPKASRMPSR